MYKSKIILFTLLLLLSSSAYSSNNVERYKKDADALCEVYNPIHWQDFVKTHDAYDIYQELGDRTRVAIKTEEFRAIFKRLAQKKHIDYKAYLHEEISRLTGEEWKCSYFDEFDEAPPRKEIQLTINGVKKVKPSSQSDEIVVTIDTGGKFTVNGKPLINNKESTAMQALKIVAKGKKPKIVIQADAMTTHNLVTRVLYVANSLGMKSVSIVVE